MMAITFLQAVNSTLKRVREIQGDAGELATDTTSTATGYTPTGPFTDSARQNQIDIMLQVWNEALAEIKRRNNIAPALSTATLTLVTAQREYSMPSDFERFAGDSKEQRAFRGATHQWLIYEKPGGYMQLLAEQPGLASQWQGEANYYAISPVTLRTIRLDMEPPAALSGWTYNAMYEVRIARTSTMATDTMPYTDTVIDALVPVVAQGWERVWKKEFDAGLFQTSISRALELAGQHKARTSYGYMPPRRYG